MAEEQMAELILNSAFTHSLMLVVPAVLALLLRIAGVAGWRTVAGLLAGVLLGPSLLGRIAPDMYERHFVGAVEERVALIDTVTAHEAELAVAARTVTDEGQAKLRAEHVVREAELEGEWRDARWAFQRPFRSYTAAIIVFALLGSGLTAVRHRDTRQGALAPISIGLWSAAVPGGLAAWYMVATGRSDHALWFAVAAVAIGPWSLTTADRVAADRAEVGGAHMVQNAGRVAALLAIVIAFGAATAGARDRTAILWALPLLALPVGWLLPNLWQTHQAKLHAIFDHMIVPTLATVVAMRIDVVAHFDIWAVIVFVVFSADARWIGATLGALVPGGRARLRTMRLLVGAMACGPTQLAVVATALSLEAIDDTVALALLVGAVMLEVTETMRRSIAVHFEGTERELEEFRDDD